ncbi:sensor histidine kinase [Vagococcus bubulae]|uniref:histidine kinase n=1 Tax=Vagococcus bubulae TaxID=1977868 RepID=A0A429ZRA5_9ENTE|nr:HAMP domain-containing sensor histidine kinase [Vagococcus bubulae]RST96178.1 hypothetical protein CBF36_00145 [Vagococcus bubulae]
MGSRKGLTQLVTKYAVMELLYTFFVMVFFFVLLNILVNVGIIYPANYPESQLNQVEKEFKSDNWTPESLPFFYDYEYIKKGNIVDNTINQTYQSYVKTAKKTGRASKDSFIGARVFRYYTVGEKELIVSYKLSMLFSSKSLNQVIPHVEGFYWFLVFFVWISGFLFLIVRLTKRLKREIQKISTASVYIQQHNLDYPRMTSDYKEINEVLSTIDVLAHDLKESLQEQWQMQENQRHLIESVTHDIRTPITLVKGNLELLSEEELTETSYERVSDMEKGVSRLESYVEKLRMISTHMFEEKKGVTKDVLNNWIDMAQLLCDTHHRTLMITCADISDKLLETDGIAMALQNIMINAIEHSKINSTILLDFSDNHDDYRITVTDEGTGFSDVILEAASRKYVSSKLDNTTSHGLGLHIVKEIVKRNNGQLIIKNRDHFHQTGAVISMVFIK